MNHEELLKVIDLHISIGYAQSGFSEYAANGTKCEQALRKVVEAHKPIWDNQARSKCVCREDVAWPCSTFVIIQQTLCDHTYIEPIYMPGWMACLKCEHVKAVEED